MRKLIFLFIFLIVLAGLWLGARAFVPGLRPAQAPAAGTTAAVVTGTLEAVVTAQGKLEPKDYVDVGAQVSGLIVKMHAETGDSVRNGDLIAEIDPDVYEAQVKGDEARLKTLEAQRAEQTALVAQARQKRDRNAALYKDQAVSREASEDAQTGFNVAAARLVSLEAQIDEARSRLEGSRANLNYTRIYAPMDGTVVSQSVKEGQTINANQTAPVIAQVANLDTMTVRAQVAEADIGKLYTEMPVYFTTLGAQDRRWEGRVRQILPAPETVNDVVLYNVLVDAENEDRRLMTGMTTQMFFVLGRAEDAPVIPAAALLKRVPEADTDEGQAYEVRVAGPAPETRTVIVSLSDRSRAAIAKGLRPGETVMLAAPPPAAQNDMARMRGRMGRL